MKYPAGTKVNFNFFGRQCLATVVEKVEDKKNIIASYKPKELIIIRLDKGGYATFGKSKNKCFIQNLVVSETYLEEVS